MKDGARMPRRRGGRSTPRRASNGPGRTSTTGGAGKTVLAFVLGAAAASGAGYLYLRSTPHGGPPPEHIATAPTEAQPSTRPPAARPLPPAHAASLTPPFGTSEDVFEAGAHIYASRCATCHGTPLKAAVTPTPSPQLWREARSASVRHTPGELFNLTSAGIPSKGMPAYAHVLTNTQLWQVALLLKSADGDLPDPVMNILNAPPKR